LTSEERATGFELEKFGIVSRHAYGILNVKKLIVKGKTLRLLRIRNPWGQFVWTGDYADGSKLWSKELKELVDFRTAPGEFWMTWEDFQKFFHDVTVCLIGYNNYLTQSFDGIYDKDHLYGFQAELKVEPSESDANCHTLITVAKEDLRFAQGSDVDNRQGLYLMEKMEGGRFAYVASSGEFSRREVTLECNLKVGNEFSLLWWCWGLFFF
jgi:hypothetical protein